MRSRAAVLAVLTGMGLWGCTHPAGRPVPDPAQPTAAATPARTPPPPTPAPTTPLTATAATAAVGGGARQGEPCPDGVACAPGLVCLGYYGGAGPMGGRLSSCEIRCGKGSTGCPTGQSCQVISDGPGRVCRP